MPQLFLASDISQTIKLFINKAKIDPKQTKVIFIADAAEPYKFNGEDTPWIDTDRQAFLNEGFEVVEMNLGEFALMESQQTTPKASLSPLNRAYTPKL